MTQAKLFLIQEDLYKSYFFLKKYFSLEARLAYFDSCSLEVQDIKLELYSGVGAVDIMNQEIENKILDGFKLINILDNFDLSESTLIDLTDYLLAIHKYLDLKFANIEVELESKEFILSKYDLDQILLKEKRKMEL